MNFFLDSTVFQKGKDIFFKNRLSHEFLNICRQQNFSIYISSVVLEEIRRHYGIFINDQIKNINRGIGAINTIPDFHYTSVYLPSYEEIMKSFDSYFEKLQDEGLLHIVHYSNDILPELISRSIYRIKPFTESKQEFRDAIIWFSYAKLAEDKDLENCFFISGNTSDYLDEEGEIHEDLAIISEKFAFFRDIYSILNSKFLEPFKETNALLESLKVKEWDNKTILGFLNGEASQTYILKRLNDDIDNQLREELWSNRTYYSQRKISNLDIVSLSRASIRGIDFINDDFVVSGQFEVKIKYTSTIETDSKELMDDQIDYDELMIFFDAVYKPDTDKFHNLEISSYTEAHDYWMNVHRIAQDRF